MPQRLFPAAVRSPSLLHEPRKIGPFSTCVVLRCWQNSKVLSPTGIKPFTCLKLAIWFAKVKSFLVFFSCFFPSAPCLISSLCGLTSSLFAPTLSFPSSYLPVFRQCQLSIMIFNTHLAVWGRLQGQGSFSLEQISFIHCWALGGNFQLAIFSLQCSCEYACVYVCGGMGQWAHVCMSVCACVYTLFHENLRL